MSMFSYKEPPGDNTLISMQTGIVERLVLLVMVD